MYVKCDLKFGLSPVDHGIARLSMSSPYAGWSSSQQVSSLELYRLNEQCLCSFRLYCVGVCNDSAVPQNQKLSPYPDGLCWLSSSVSIFMSIFMIPKKIFIVKYGLKSIYYFLKMYVSVLLLVIVQMSAYNLSPFTWKPVSNTKFCEWIFYLFN